jgi:transcriptional regulator with XRE-family HTH domain
MSFCEVLRDLRTEKGVTQKEVATACGITPTCICQLESGARNPTGSTLRMLAIYFNVTADYLLELENDFGVRTASPMSDGLTTNERDLLENFRELSPYLQSVAIDTVRSWANKTDNSQLNKKA